MSNRSSFWFSLIAIGLVSIVVGSLAYNAGVAHGVAVAANGTPGWPMWAVWGGGWYPGFHPFGFVFPLFFLFGFFFLIRRLMWGAGRHWGPPAWSERFDQWHRDAHERMNKPL